MSAKSASGERTRPRVPGFGALAKRTLAPSAQKVHAGEGAGISTRGACAPQNNLAFPLRSRSCDTRQQLGEFAIDGQACLRYM